MTLTGPIGVPLTLIAMAVAGMAMATMMVATMMVAVMAVAMVMVRDGDTSRTSKNPLGIPI